MKPIELKPRKQRNPFVAAALLKKAGKHRNQKREAKHSHYAFKERL